MTIKDLQPSIVWNNFYSITRCPRPSKHEEIIRKFLLDWAKEHKIEAFTDEPGNVIDQIRPCLQSSTGGLCMVSIRRDGDLRVGSAKT